MAAPIECVVEDNSSVVVRMNAPHPKEVLLYRPDGDIVWLQNNDSLAHEQIANFERLKEWKIDASTVGTVYNDCLLYTSPSPRD